MTVTKVAMRLPADVPIVCVGGLIELHRDGPEIGQSAMSVATRVSCWASPSPLRPTCRLTGLLHQHGGSAIGNSRVKLTNVADCVKRGLVEGSGPVEGPPTS